jgi:hypothetical protein
VLQLKNILTREIGCKVEEKDKDKKTEQEDKREQTKRKLVKKERQIYTQWNKVDRQGRQDKQDRQYKFKL